MNFRSERSSWWLIGILIGALALYGYFALWPQYKEVRRRQAYLSQLEAKLKEQWDVVGAIHQTQKELERINTYLQNWERHSPNPKELAPFFAQIAQIANLACVTPTRFSPGKRIPHDRVAKIPLTIECRGTFAQIYKFLYLLEYLPQILWIEHLTIERPSQESPSLQCQISLVVFTDNLENSNQIKDTKKPI